jgi:L-asparaginase
MPVGLIATGGTIASLPDPESGAPRPAVGPEELLRSIPQPAEAGEIVTRELGRVSGWDMTPALMLQVAREARELVRDGGVSGVVVTHGTDTIEETAFLCDLLLDSEAPVVFTAAMRSFDEPGADGPCNLLNALRAARSPKLRGHGAVVAMNDELHAARWVRKLDSCRISAFSSPNRGPVALVSDGSLTFGRPPPTRVSFPLPAELPAVSVASAFTGARAELIEAIMEGTEARGLVVEGTGLGNLPASVVPGVERALAAGIPVVVASRTASGGTRPHYGGPGGGASLHSLGVLQAGGLPVGKARLLLSVLLGLDLSAGELRDSFAGAVERLR